MSDLHTYLPQDRLRALARNEALPDRTHGAALFADISGFTPLTEAVTQQRGPRRGLEELTRQINRVYDALITTIEGYGGSVIGFAGDAVTCWFDDRDAGGPAAVRAVACAFALQGAMEAFPQLGLKVAVATGSARRFLVGDPAIHYLDALAGGPVTRTAGGEHLAQRGEVLVDSATALAAASALTIAEWRADEASGERFAVVEQPSAIPPPSSVNPRPQTVLPAERLRPFLLPAVYEREVSGQGSFLTELRPCVVLFVRFMGLDYEADDAGVHLDRFIRRLQEIVAGYEGALLQLTIGDKGSYVYVNFGGLSAHEDDARRAVKTALELREGCALDLQMGVTQGVTRVGAYGGSTRRTYGALGDEVNLSARLMQTAAPGEILVSSAVQKAVGQRFTFEPRPPLPVKGKAEPLPVFALTGERRQRAIRLQEPTYALPMVGRTRELALIGDKLELALQGQAQVIAIVAEAGLGKSRLVAEAIRLARREGFVGYGGACQSDGVHTPYLVWKPIWSAFLDVDPELPLRRQIRLLQVEIEDRAPSRVAALPLLGTLLDLDIPDNAFTRTLEPKTRRSALHALLEECLKAAARDGPLLLVLEDLHWIDALSHDLLDELARALASYPVCIVLAYRPLQMAPLAAQRLEALPAFTQIELHELTPAEAEQAIRAKLAQLYPARSGAVPPALVERLMAHAQGNPFYLEELLNFLRDRGLDPRDPDDLDKIELPDSLYTLILSRIDRLTESERTTLRVASIVGRLFRVLWLTGYYPELGDLPQVKRDLDELDALEITPLDTPEPELAYLFKHILTHEVTYGSLPFATRSRLHERLARYLEAAYPAVPPLEALAFHYGRSEDVAKRREYLRRAGEAAQKTFANDAALAYYGQLLPLLADTTDMIAVRMRRGEVLQLMGAWAEAEADYRAALEMAQDQEDAAATAGAQYALGELLCLRGDYDGALDWLALAKAGRAALDDRAGLAQVSIETGLIVTYRGEYAQAREALEEGLGLAREVGHGTGTALALHYLGIAAMFQGDYPAAQGLYEESMALRRELGDKMGTANSLNNLGGLAYYRGDYPAARALFEESLALHREIGNKAGVSGVLNNLGGAAHRQGDYPTARALYEESLALQREIGYKTGIAISLYNLGLMAYCQGDHATARALQEESLALQHEMDDKDGMACSLNSLGNVALAQGDPAAARALHEESLALCREIGDKPDMACALLGLGLVCLAVARDGPAASLPAALAEARQHLTAGLHLSQEVGQPIQVISCVIGMAGLALQAGSARRAAQLLGAAEAALGALHALIGAEVLHFRTQVRAAVCTALGEVAFQSAWAEGAKLALDEAAKLAEQENGM